MIDNDPLKNFEGKSSFEVKVIKKYPLAFTSSCDDFLLPYLVILDLRC